MPNSIDISIPECGGFCGEANLSNAHLYKADLNDALLTYADLTNVDLRFADLSHANIHQANLTDAILLFADLSHSNLYQANTGDRRIYDLTRLAILHSNSVTNEPTFNC